MRERAQNPLEGEPEDPLTEGEEIQWPSQDEHWHVTPQSIQLVDYSEDQRDAIIEEYEDGTFESGETQVTVRNRQGNPIRTRYRWDGHQMHLDIHNTRTQMVPLSEAIRASSRYHWERHGPVLIMGLLTLLGIVLLATIYFLLG